MTRVVRGVTVTVTGLGTVAIKFRDLSDLTFVTNDSTGRVMMASYGWETVETIDT